MKKITWTAVTQEKKDYKIICSRVFPPVINTNQISRGHNFRHLGFSNETHAQQNRNNAHVNTVRFEGAVFHSKICKHFTFCQ
jgi:hypothetical protein